MGLWDFLMGLGFFGEVMKESGGLWSFLFMVLMDFFGIELGLNIRV